MGSDVLPVNLLEYEAAARALIPTPLFGFISGGSEDESSLNGNRSGFDRWRLLPRILTGSDNPSLRTTVLGQEISMPVMVSPMGIHQLAHARGELASAAGAQRVGTIYSLALAASTAMEEVAAVAGMWWFQIYLLQDRAFSLEHVRRAEDAGASAIVLTVDVPIRGRREADDRNRFDLPIGVTMPNMLPRDYTGDHLSYSVLTPWDKAISWKDLEWLVGITHLPVIVKGVLSPVDAVKCAELGAKGIIVSNHGGRQLDSAVASIDALPAVAAAVGDRAEVYIDGGIRRGTDVIKALALGARAVMIGRPVLYGLAVDGEDGVVRIFDLLRHELMIDMLLTGCDDVTRIPGAVVVPNGVVDA